MNTAVETNKPYAVKGMSQSRLKCETGLVSVDVSFVSMTHGSNGDTNAAHKCQSICFDCGIDAAVKIVVEIQMLSEQLLLLRLLQQLVRFSSMSHNLCYFSNGLKVTTTHLNHDSRPVCTVSRKCKSPNKYYTRFRGVLLVFHPQRTNTPRNTQTYIGIASSGPAQTIIAELHQWLFRGPLSIAVSYL